MKTATRRGLTSQGTPDDTGSDSLGLLRPILVLRVGRGRDGILLCTHPVPDGPGPVAFQHIGPGPLLASSIAHGLATSIKRCHFGAMGASGIFPQSSEWRLPIMLAFDSICPSRLGQLILGTVAMKQILVGVVSVTVVFSNATNARSDSQIANFLRRQSHITCEMVRAYVKRLGLEQARAMALVAGMTADQERRAARCLERKI